MKTKKPCTQNCLKCGGSDIYRKHRMPGDEIRVSIFEVGNCKARLPYLDGDWPYGWKVKSEHISHRCNICSHEWESEVLKSRE